MSSIVLLRFRPAITIAVRGICHFRRPLLMPLYDNQYSRVAKHFSQRRKLFSSDSVQSNPIEEKYTGARNAAGLKHGTGKCEFSNGCYYEGGYNLGQFHGFGKFVWATGDTYEGDFLYGLFHGLGINKLSSGEMHVGEYENGRKCGGGISTFPNGDRYEGQFFNDFIHGIGTMKYANGDVCKGDFKNGTMTGNCVFDFCNGDKYVGLMKNFALDGFGTYTFANGDVHEGHYRNSAREGPGRLVFANGNKFEGLFKENLYHGAGLFTYANGDIFSCTYRDGFITDGVGMMKFANGDKFVGHWVEGKQTTVGGEYQRMPYRYENVVMTDFEGSRILLFTDGTALEGLFLSLSLSERPGWGWVMPSNREVEPRIVNREGDKLSLVSEEEVKRCTEGKNLRSVVDVSEEDNGRNSLS